MNKKVILSSFVGNALEFFDFTLCGVFIMTLSCLFFPTSNPKLSILAGMFAFSAAFYSRPFGALLFGYLGDKYGRRKVLSTTVFLMGIPTFIIGILPSYDQIGIFAPIILIICRLLQGLCAGGEYNGAAIFALEHAQGKNPGLISGIISCSSVVGILTATIFGSLFLYDGAPTWFWRIPFICGAFISIVGYFLRRYTFETTEFSQLKKGNHSPNKDTTSYRKYISPFIVSITVGALNGALCYSLFGFFNIYMAKFVGFHTLKGIWSNLTGIISFALCCVIFGLLSDYFGKRKLIKSAFLLSFTLALPTFFLLNQPNIISVLFGQVLFGLICGSFVGPTHHFLHSLFPVAMRYKGIAFGFCIGITLTGGTTAMFLTYIIMKTQNLYAPAFLIMTYALLFKTSLWLLPQEK